MMTLKRILVPTDFGEAAGTALSYGRAMAQAFGATLHVLHVTQDMVASSLGVEMASGPAVLDVQREVDAFARKELERLVGSEGGGPPTKLLILTSNAPAGLIVQYAKNQQIDLIVMGTHGRRKGRANGTLPGADRTQSGARVRSGRHVGRPGQRLTRPGAKPCALPPLRPPHSMHPPTVR